ncbi:MAG: oxidoreductase, partial [Deltaproteobacteria bacterium]|nr:oxidoreductase [Deltaproteobacteria bacterium]
FFDMLLWIFGGVRRREVHVSESGRMAGFLELEKAEVRWFLSVDRRDLPPEAVQGGKTTYRSITVDGEEFEFSGGFTDLHTVVYRETLAGRGFGIEEVRPSIDLVHQLRHAVPERAAGTPAHPFLGRP